MKSNDRESLITPVYLKVGTVIG